jgi:RimJ/RimL family protein N-acetyltransferase
MSERTRNAERVLFDVYAARHGIDAEELSRKGNALRYVEGLEGENRLYVTTPVEKTLISVAPSIADKLGKDFLSSCSLEELAARFTGWKLEDRHPHLIYEKSVGPEFHHPSAYEIRTIDPTNHSAIRAFLDRSSADDIDDALIDPEDPDEEIRMAYCNGVPVGYAGYRVWEEGLADTGILIHPDDRGRGLGTSLVGEVTCACVADGRIPLWRTWDGNPGSLRVAENNGFVLKWRTSVYAWDSLKKTQDRW